MDQRIGNYRITGELSRGGMGIVYRAEHTTMGQQVVVKKLLPEYSTNQEVVGRFFREAKAAATIDDPGIVKIFDHGVCDDGSAYIVMELLKGESLAARLGRERTIPDEQAVMFLRQTARAVGAAHARGIIHRDLKPDNVFLVPDPEIPGGVRAKVLDFGIAKLHGEVNATHLRTRAGMPMGTPPYMSPEQWSSAGHVDARTDVYALGCILHQMLTGEPPFPGPGLPEYMDQHRFTPPPLPSAANPRLAPFDPVIARSLAKRADERFASVDELVRAMPGSGVYVSSPAAAPAGAGGAQAVTPFAGGQVAPATQGGGGSRKKWVIAASVIVAAAGATAIALVISRGPRAPVAPETPAPAGLPPAAPAAPAAAAEVPARDAATENALGGLMGDEIGSAGMGSTGLGAGGGATGAGTIGTGDYGTIGHGSGAGSGYGSGAGRIRGRSATPSASAGDPVATGSLDKDIIRRHIRRKLPQITYCYQKELAVKPELQGKVTVDFVIGTNGEVTSVSASGMGDEAVEKCIASVIRSIVFPKPSGGIVKVKYPFTF